MGKRHGKIGDLFFRQKSRDRLSVVVGGGLDCDFDKRLSISSVQASANEGRREKASAWTAADGREDISFIESSICSSPFSASLIRSLIECAVAQPDALVVG
jgi:hypothetical protein